MVCSHLCVYVIQSYVHERQEVFKNTVGIILPLLKHCLLSSACFYSFNMRPDAVSRQTAHQHEWQEGCKPPRSSPTGSMHSVVQGKELHEVALIMVMYFIPPCGDFLFTLVVLQGFKGHGQQQNKRFSVLLKDTKRACMLSKRNLRAAPRLSSAGWIWLTLRFDFLLLNK